eukprot:TRINITY_DN676_c0_g1_i1.p1 TRINITY_DN676_c0_g1~~TRINITY_DN676_c0_g1_i1.p1  ORF type:complete len:102 (-),score=26.04 TRINITY_DN676_c0_g1_i1:359-664(-)
MNLHITDEIDGLAGSEQQLAKLVKSLDETSSARYSTEISAEKTVLMASHNATIITVKTVHGLKLGTVQQFTYWDPSSTVRVPNQKSYQAKTTSALSRLKPI